MHKFFGFGLLALALVPVAATADPWKDESGKGREGAKKFFEERRKHEEKVWEERRKAEERHHKEFEQRREAAEKWREKTEERREQDRERFRGHREEDRWAGPPYLLPPSHGQDHGYVPGYGDDFRGYGYGSGVYRDYSDRHYDGYGGYAGHGYGRDRYDGSTVYRPDYGDSGYGPSDVVPPYLLPPGDDDLDAVYTPFGFYEEVPDVGYGGYGPRPKGYGQIGPYRFEVWEHD